MRKIIGYIRVSTELQERKGYGLKVQEDRIKSFAKANGFELLKIFRDEGVSGALKDRPALISLLDFAEEHKNEDLSLVILRLDRLARDLLLQENLISDFKKKGLKVVSIEEPDLCDNNPTRKLFRQMKGMLAEYEKSMITLRMSAGRLKKVELGKGYAGGNVAYGFRVENGKYTKVPSEIEVVRQIFKHRRKPKYGKPLSYQKIADQLNNEGVDPPNGKRWYAMTVRLIYKNRFYRGWQGYSSIKYYNSVLRII